MPEEESYIFQNKLILTGSIKTITDLMASGVEKTRFAKSIGTSPARLNRLIANPSLFTFNDAYRMAELIKVDEKYLVEIIHQEWLLHRSQK